jgi:hypothetical protein
MTGLDRRRPGRYASDRTAPMPLQAGEPTAGRAAGAPRDRAADAGAWAAAVAEIARCPPAGDLPPGAFDAPYPHPPSAVMSAQAVMQVRPEEAIAAITGISMLAKALQRLGLQAETRGYVMSVGQPGGNNQASRYEVVVLGHHPHHEGRLWWWLLAAGPVSPDERWGPQAMLRPISPIEQIASVADHLARTLRANTEGEPVGQRRTTRPANDWPMP